MALTPCRRIVTVESIVTVATMAPEVRALRHKVRMSLDYLRLFES